MEETKIKKEHPYYKNKRIEEISEAKKSYLVSVYAEDNFREIKRFAKDLEVTFQTLLVKIRYWHFERTRLNQ